MATILARSYIDKPLEDRQVSSALTVTRYFSVPTRFFSLSVQEGLNQIAHACQLGEDEAKLAN